MGTLKRILIFLGVLVVGVLGTVAIMGYLFGPDIPHSRGPTGSTRQEWTQAVLPEQRRWEEVGRKLLVSQAFDLTTTHGWIVNSSPVLRGNYRLLLVGQFSCSEPITFVVMDAENWNRFRSGYPPLLIYSVRTGQPIRAAWPAQGSFYGFARLPAESQAARLPSSLTDLLVQLAARAAAENRPPARATVELFAVAECFCTDAEAAAARR